MKKILAYFMFLMFLAGTACADISVEPLLNKCLNTAGTAIRVSVTGNVSGDTVTAVNLSADTITCDTVGINYSGGTIRSTTITADTNGTGVATTTGKQFTFNPFADTVDYVIKSKNSATAFVINSDATAGNEYISTTLPNIYADTYSGTATTKSILNFEKSANATSGSHTIVVDGEDLGQVTFKGSDGTNFDTAAYILAEVDGTPGAGTDMPGRLTFWTSPDASATPVERMRIDNAGKVFVGGTAGGTTYSDFVSGVTTGSGASHSITILSDTAGKSQVMFGDALNAVGEYDGLLRYDHGLRGMEFWSAGVNRLQIDSSGGVQGSVYSVAKQHDEIGVLLNDLTAAKAIVGFTGTGATTATEAGYESGAGRTWTYSGGLAADKIFQGSTYVYSFDGVDSYLTTPDSDDMSFTNDSNDSAYSMGGWIQVVDNTGGYQTIIAKNTVNQNEYHLRLNTDETLLIDQYDDNANKECYRTTNAALSVGWHFVVVTQSGTGGATAMNTALMYVDGVVVASTATNDAGYVAMQRGTSTVDVGMDSAHQASWAFEGDMGRLFVTGEALSAATIWKMYEKTRGYYNK